MRVFTRHRPLGTSLQDLLMTDRDLIFTGKNSQCSELVNAACKHGARAQTLHGAPCLALGEQGGVRISLNVSEPQFQNVGRERRWEKRIRHPPLASNFRWGLSKEQIMGSS